MPQVVRRSALPLAFAAALVWGLVSLVSTDEKPLQDRLRPESAPAAPAPPRALEFVPQEELRRERDALAATFLEDMPDSSREEAASRSIEIHARLLVDEPDPAEVSLYKTVRGDTLGRIARRFKGRKGVAGAIVLVNRLENPDRLAVGQLLRIPRGDWSIVVDQSLFTLYLCYRGAPFRAYPVAIGAEGKTPSGSYRVDSKVHKPMWWPPRSAGLAGPIPYGDPRNQLGDWWIGLKHRIHRGIGIHGTNDPDSIGTAASLGCVRMGDAAMDEVASVAYVGMPATILD